MRSGSKPPACTRTYLGAALSVRRMRGGSGPPLPLPPLSAPRMRAWSRRRHGLPARVRTSCLCRLCACADVAAGRGAPARMRTAVFPPPSLGAAPAQTAPVSLCLCVGESLRQVGGGEPAGSECPCARAGGPQQPRHPAARPHQPQPQPGPLPLSHPYPCDSRPLPAPPGPGFMWARPRPNPVPALRQAGRPLLLLPLVPPHNPSDYSRCLVALSEALGLPAPPHVPPRPPPSAAVLNVG